MTLTNKELKQVRTVVRQELRRKHEGICCPECGERQLPAAEWDRHQPADDEMWLCDNCGFEAPPAEYKNATAEDIPV